MNPEKRKEDEIDQDGKVEASGEISNSFIENSFQHNKISAFTSTNINIDAAGTSAACYAITSSSMDPLETFCPRCNGVDDVEQLKVDYSQLKADYNKLKEEVTKLGSDNTMLRSSNLLLFSELVKSRAALSAKNVDLLSQLLEENAQITPKEKLDRLIQNDGNYITFSQQRSLCSIRVNIDNSDFKKCWVGKTIAGFVFKVQVVKTGENYDWCVIKSGPSIVIATVTFLPFGPGNTGQMHKNVKFTQVLHNVGVTCKWLPESWKENGYVNGNGEIEFRTIIKIHQIHKPQSNEVMDISPHDYTADGARHIENFIGS
ncbi:hypothetical protein Ddc_13419 [Ditylenchus destructor]|nr:hypothetical protein Ddc_13419 [Ditylenchus destructor]